MVNYDMKISNSVHFEKPRRKKIGALNERLFCMVDLSELKS